MQLIVNDPKPEIAVFDLVNVKLIPTLAVLGASSEALYEDIATLLSLLSTI